jgi:D-hydroxyproline dehydrogenase
MRESTEIAVIGAGVVGLSVALRLAQAGHEVALVAPAGTGDGASFGNAGVIADYAVLPVGRPDVLRDLPALLLGHDSPLSLRWAALPALAPWLMRFAWQSLPGPARRNARALAALLAEAAAEWRALAAEIDASALLRPRGTLYAYEAAREMRRAQSALAWQRDLGVRLELVGADDLGQMEPGLPRGRAVGAAFFPDTLSLGDPGAMLRRLEAAVAAAGVARIEAEVAGLRRQEAGTGVALTGPGLTLKAGRVVIAAGAWSRPLALAAGDRVPLDTERGYHLEYDMDVPPLTRPLTPARRGFYFCPMEGRLRVAGTVELGGLAAPRSPRRLALLEAGARAVLPELPAPDRSWMGFRPSLPDSLPVIGPSRTGDSVLMAFGHGHLGLTLAPLTARIVAALVAGREPGLDLTPYLPGRF